MIAAKHDPTSVTRCATMPIVVTGSSAAPGPAAYVDMDQTATEIASLHVLLTQEHAMSETHAITALACSVLLIAADELSLEHG